jgi:Anti-sigma-K factor rskA
MTNSMGDDMLRELLALEAVGALSDDERAELDAAIEDRPDLRAELESMRGAAATLAEAVSEQPPPSLRARVLETVATTPQDQALPAQPVRPVAPAPAAETEPPPAPVIPITAARSHRWLRWGAVAAAAAAIVIAVLVVAPFDGDDGVEVADVIDAQDARTIELTGELSGLRLVHSASADATVLEGEGITPPAGTNVFELWRVAEAPEAVVREFRPNDDGSVAVLVEGLDPGEDVFAVTEEPEGGSDAPTTEPIAMTPEA